MGEAVEEGGTGRGRQSERVDRRRSAVLDAAVQVILERGAPATRYSDIAEASGVPIGTLQYYFGSREELLIAAFRHGATSNRDRLGAYLGTLESPWDKLKVMVDARITAYDITSTPSSLLYVEFFRLALRDPTVRADVLADYRGWRELIAGVIAEGKMAGEFDGSIDPDQVALQVLAMLGGLVTPLALSEPSLPTAQARELMISSLAALVGPRPGLVAEHFD